VIKNKKHIQFIKLVADGETQAKAFVSTCKKGVSKKIAEVRGCELAKKYAKEIELERERTRMIVEAAQDSDTVKNALKEVLTKAERMKILSDQAKGITEIEDAKPVWNPIQKSFQIVKVKTVANFSERKNAIAELNKMDGSYDADKLSEKLNVPILTIDPLAE